MIYEAMVRLVQTVYLSCTETNTIFKWTKTRFYMTYVINENASSWRCIYPFKVMQRINENA
jgi:hypothetical protein